MYENSASTACRETGACNTRGRPRVRQVQAVGMELRHHLEGDTCKGYRYYESTVPRGIFVAGTKTGL